MGKILKWLAVLAVGAACLAHDPAAAEAADASRADLVVEQLERSMTLTGPPGETLGMRVRAKSAASSFVLPILPNRVEQVSRVLAVEGNSIDIASTLPVTKRHPDNDE